MNKALKWTLIIIGILIVIGIIGFQIFLTYTKSHSPQEVVSLNEGEVEITVEYSRPYKKGRIIFGGLVPYGKVWRTGANEATIFTTSIDLVIDGKTLPAGKYSLWTTPRTDGWIVIFNSETGQWGVKGPGGEDNRDPAYDVLTAEAEVFPVNEEVEQFTIALENAEGIELVFTWENVLVMLPIDY